jgi:hypothetical protein
MVKRLPDWADRLARFLDERRNAAFDPQTHNCALFACDAIAAMTGVDLAAEFRGRANLMDLQPQLEAIFDQVGEANGLVEIPLARAHRGDVVLIRRGEHAALGIMGMGMNGAVVAAGDGLATVPVSCCLRARRVPY